MKKQPTSQSISDELMDGIKGMTEAMHPGSTGPDKTIKQISEFSDHALSNICCSGNNEWSKAAIKELDKRKNGGKDGL